ncbi:MAG TPA: hypothetical protein VIM49_02080, partial [Dermatophilaceae bacterium]
AGTYTLTASDGSLGATTSTSVTVTAGAAGNTVTTDTSAVTLTMTNLAGATLRCDSNPEVARLGIASFAGCTIDKAGTYTLTASDGILTAATSTSVNIVPGVPAAVTAVLGSDQSAVVGREFAGPLVARVTDANDNPVPDVTVAFTAPNTPAGATGTFAGSAHATTALTDADGRATSGVLTANTTSGTYSLTATTGSVRATFTLTNSPGAATTFAITSAPVTGPASATATLGPITVQRQDLYGNPVSAPAGGTEVTIASDSSGTSVFATTLAGTSVTSILIPSGKSSATFYYGDSAPGSPVITIGPVDQRHPEGTILAAPIPTTITAAPVGP